MDKEELQRRVDELEWFHKIELPYGEITPGAYPLTESKYQFPDDLTGKRVLDVGAWDGFWTFKALERGASEVVAIDDFSDKISVFKPRARSGWRGFDLCREMLGYKPAQCQRREMSVYEVSEAKMGRFDLVLCYGILYHLRYPLLALDKLSEICDSQIRVESAVANYYSAHRGGLTHGYGTELIAEYLPGIEYGGNDTNWWVPTLRTLGAWVAGCGWSEGIFGWVAKECPTSLCQCRGFVTANKQTEKG